jgi:hypothetical protein
MSTQRLRLCEALCGQAIVTVHQSNSPKSAKAEHLKRQIALHITTFNHGGEVRLSPVVFAGGELDACRSIIIQQQTFRWSYKNLHRRARGCDPGLCPI